MKMNRKRSGVSTVIAELLLVVMVMAGGALVVAFAYNVFNGVDNTFGSQIQQAGDSLQGNVNIIHVDWNNSMTGGTVYIQDDSNVQETVEVIQVSDVSGCAAPCLITTAVFSPFTFVLQPHQIQAVHFSFSVSPLTFYQFLVIAKDGNNQVQEFQSGCPRSGCPT